MRRCFLAILPGLLLVTLLVDVSGGWAAHPGANPQRLKPGDSFRDRLKNGYVGPEMVVIPPGSFLMGDEQMTGYAFSQPVHRVTIARPFAIGKYEVTFAEYDLFCRETGRKFPDDETGGRENRPVINVTWFDAVAYTKWLTLQTGKHYRLPAEAEWAYAARAGTADARFWGNNADEACGFANVADLTAREIFPELKKFHACKDGFPFTAPTGFFPPNLFGLHDMLGNVWEWCSDVWHSNYEGAPNDGSSWGGSGSENRVRRGGSWFSIPKSVSSSARNANPRGYYGNETGFRVVRDLTKAE